MKLTHILRNGLIALSAVFALTACTENVDMSNRYTFTEYTVLSYLEQDSAYTEYVKLINKVHISDYSESTVAQLLSARGHITCFAPNNEAIQDYLDSLQRKGIISAANWDGFPSEHVKDSIEKVIVYKARSTPTASSSMENTPSTCSTVTSKPSTDESMRWSRSLHQVPTLWQTS